jgi:hypothetical protein
LNIPVQQPGCGPCWVWWILMKICGKLTAQGMGNACSVAFCNWPPFSDKCWLIVQIQTIIQWKTWVYYINASDLMYCIRNNVPLSYDGAYWGCWWSVRGDYKCFTSTWKWPSLESCMKTHMLVSVQGVHVLAQVMFKLWRIYDQSDGHQPYCFFSHEGRNLSFLVLTKLRTEHRENW